jgi:hypothetical protein
MRGGEPSFEKRLAALIRQLADAPDIRAVLKVRAEAMRLTGEVSGEHRRNAAAFLHNQDPSRTWAGHIGDF